MSFALKLMEGPCTTEALLARGADAMTAFACHRHPHLRAHTLRNGRKKKVNEE